MTPCCPIDGLGRPAYERLTLSQRETEGFWRFMRLFCKFTSHDSMSLPAAMRWLGQLLGDPWADLEKVTQGLTQYRLMKHFYCGF